MNANPTTLQEETIPEGFPLLDQVTGVRLFRKDYTNGTPDFVQVVDMNQGAAVKLLHGPVTEQRAGKGAFGGNDARIRSQTLASFWKAMVKKAQNTFCVTNGQFFYMPASPTRLTLPLKVDGQVITDGFAADQYIGKRLMIELCQEHADIRELSRDALYNSTAPDILGGRTVDANRRAKARTGRTFAGVDDRDRDGLYETVLIFNTRTALQTDAAAVLRSFGADKVVMLDGGGSTQLMCQGKPVIFSERLIPQAIAIIAGDGPNQVQSQARTTGDKGGSVMTAQIEKIESVTAPQAVPEIGPSKQPANDQTTPALLSVIPSIFGYWGRIL